MHGVAYPGLHSSISAALVFIPVIQKMLGSCEYSTELVAAVHAVIL